MGMLPACSVAMRDGSLSVATTSGPASARQLPETSPTYPHPITANFTRDFPLRWSYILTILSKICTNSFSPNRPAGGKGMQTLMRSELVNLPGLNETQNPTRFSDRTVYVSFPTIPHTAHTSHHSYT